MGHFQKGSLRNHVFNNFRVKHLLPPTQMPVILELVTLEFPFVQYHINSRLPQPSSGCNLLKLTANLRAINKGMVPQEDNLGFQSYRNLVAGLYLLL